jgi:hypothetical protein
MKIWSRLGLVFLIGWGGFSSPAFAKKDRAFSYNPPVSLVRPSVRESKVVASYVRAPATPYTGTKAAGKKTRK